MVWRFWVCECDMIYDLTNGCDDFDEFGGSVRCRN